MLCYFCAVNVIKNLFRFYINASIHVAFAVVFLQYLIACCYLKITISLPVMAFVFLGTITGYNFIKYASIAGFKHFVLTTKMRVIQIFSGVVFLGLLALLPFVAVQTLWLLLILGIITFFYAFPLSRKQNLRQISGLKIVLTAVVWSGVAVLVPVLEFGLELNTKTWVLYVQILLFVIVLTLPFEIRDLREDPSYLNTFPQLLGVKKAKIVGFFLGVLILGVEILKHEKCTSQFVLFLIGIVLVLTFLKFSTQKQHTYYASFWVESVPIIWFIIYLILEQFFPS